MSGRRSWSVAERDAVHAFVRCGGGLVVLGETEQDKYGNNVNELLERFDLRLRSDTVQDYEHCDGAPTWIHGELLDGGRGSGGDLLAGVSARLLLPRDHDRESQRREDPGPDAPLGIGAGAPLIVASEHGQGRVVVLADSDLFGDDCIRLIRPCCAVVEHRRLGGPAVR